MKLHSSKALQGRRGRAAWSATIAIMTFGAVAGGFALLPLLGAGASAQTAPAATTPEPAAEKVPVNVSITPKRLTFSRGERSASVYIFNQGRTPATYDISMIDSVMLPNGDIRPFEEAQAAADLKPIAEKLQSAKSMVLVAPRRATLAPGKGQTVRIRVTLPAGSTGAEYRSHLLVRTVPSRNVGVTAEDAAAQGSNQLSFRITPVFGLSIPVIVRSGTTDVRGDIRNPRLTYADISPDGVAPARRTPVLAFDVGRSGANSLFGNIEVHSKSGGKTPVGMIRGVGLYTEIDHRSIQIPLQRAPAPGEQLDISFVDDDITPGRVVARSSFTAP